MELHHHFSHQHPLEFIEQHNLKSEKANCSGCGELVSGPSFSCTECGFYLDKKCFEASSEVGELEGVSQKDLLVSSENGSEELEET
ncbi:hypothetical protein Goklo_005180, partial [Gossypium klotzschianum]|nr:hypothetical protein [Gossypium klotzschianum]